MPKNKRPLYIGISLFILFLLLIGTITIFRPVQETSYFYDEDLGIVETQYKVYNKWNKWMGFFQQAVTFSPHTAELGDTISLRDEYLVFGTSTGCGIGWMQIRVHGPTQDTLIPHIVFDKIALTFDSIDKTQTITVNHVGTYTATTTYYETCYDIFTRDPIGCDECTGSFTSASLNSVIVSAPVPTCNKNPYWSDWVHDTNINNGVYNKRIYYEVDGSCDYYETNVEWRTTCNNGYYITGTTNNVGSDKLSCELASIEPECTKDSDCTSQICENEICVDGECNADLTIECWDNSIIITKECINMRLVDTNNECPIQDNGDIDDDIDNDIDDTTNDDNFVDDTNYDFVDDTNDNDYTPEDEDFNYALILLIGGIIIALGITGWILYSRYKK